MFISIVWLLSSLLCESEKTHTHLWLNTSSNGSSDSVTICQSLNLAGAKSRDHTGVLNMEIGGQSFVTRLWLLKHAKKTLDIQYFSFARSITGLIACDYLVAAADRGVKIRLLVDELSGRMNAREIKILDRHENIEVRVYNAGVKLGRLDKKLKYLIKNRRRLLRRMHNKTLPVDGEACVLGGRNISDEYFDFDKKYNFRDRDVLLLGQAVKEVTSVFNDYWNSDLTVACNELVGKTDKKFSVDALFSKWHDFKADTALYYSGIRRHVDSFPVFFKGCIGSGDFQWADKVTFVSDVPGKNEDRKKRKGGNCEDTIIKLIRNAKTSIDVNTPYFVTTDEARNLLTETVGRGVKMKVLTNSLASIDNNIAFSPYKRDRKKNLKTGIELFEFRPDAAVRFKIMSPDAQADLHYEPVFGLHSKSIVIDTFITVIGSYNLEPRSANLNTECVAIIRSAKIAHNVSKYIQEEFQPENSWRITPKYNPDRKASLKKRISVFIGHIIPKQTL